MAENYKQLNHSAEEIDEAILSEKTHVNDAVSHITAAERAKWNNVDNLQTQVNNLVISGTTTEGNAELLDMRVGADGVTYPSAGTAVRTQFNKVSHGYGKYIQMVNGVLSVDFNKVIDIPKNTTVCSSYVTNETSGVSPVTEEDFEGLPVYDRNCTITRISHMSDKNTTEEGYQGATGVCDMFLAEYISDEGKPVLAIAYATSATTVSEWVEIEGGSSLSGYGLYLHKKNGVLSVPFTKIIDLPLNRTICYAFTTAPVTEEDFEGLPVYDRNCTITRISHMSNPNPLDNKYVPTGTHDMFLAEYISDEGKPVLAIAYATSATTLSDWVELGTSDNVVVGGMNMFERIGVIGDSISVGWMKDKNGNTVRRNTKVSWVQQMARQLGCTAYNFGASGVDPVEWFKTDFEFAEYCYTQYTETEACDLYIIGLGLNQATLGTIDDIKADYTQNAETFYGQYARIIQTINADHPNSIVICLTEPSAKISEYDEAVREICKNDNVNAILVDLENDYSELFNNPKIESQKYSDGLHFTPYGYTLIADATIKALNDFISKNSDKFKYVGV